MKRLTLQQPSITKRASLAALVLALAAPHAHAAPPAITDLAEIPLSDGLNHIEKFTPDGRAADIIDAWRDNLNAHAYHLYLVTTDAGVVSFETGPGSSSKVTDIITDEPHTGEDTVKAVRFARGRVNGQAATLVLTATRQWKQSLSDPAPVDYAVFQLSHRDECCGTPDFFRQIHAETSKESYVNADDAMTRRFGLGEQTPPAR